MQQLPSEVQRLLREAGVWGLVRMLVRMTMRSADGREHLHYALTKVSRGPVERGLFIIPDDAADAGR